MVQINLFTDESKKTSELLSFALPVRADGRIAPAQEDVRALWAKIFTMDLAISAISILPSWEKEIKFEELIRAVGATTRIEGNVLTDKQVEEVITKIEEDDALPPAAREVLNSKKVYDFCLGWISDNPTGKISVPLIRQIHKLNTQKIHSPDNEPGDFRKGERQIGYPPRRTLLHHYWEIQEHMERYVNWLNDDNQPSGWDEPIRTLIKPIMAHYYLTEIHPFGDGNGRTARALESLLLFKNTGYNRFGFYAIANHCYRERTKYIDLLSRIYVTPDLTEFVLFCLKGLADSLEYVHGKITDKIHKLVFEDYLRQKERTRNIRRKEAEIVRLLMLRESIDYDEYMKENVLGLKPSTRYNYLRKLQREELVIVKNKEEGSKSRVILPNYDVVKGLSLRIPRREA